MKKILIIIGSLEIGGAERFATNISRYAPKGKFDFTYLIFKGLGDTFANEIRDCGGKIIEIASPHEGYINYIRNLRKILDDNKYDVVHSHTQFNSGINLMIAGFAGVPGRIAHSHTTAHEEKISFSQYVYEQVMRKLILKYSTSRFACGVDAGKWMFGKNVFTIINNGINTEAYKYSDRSRNTIRDRYSIPNEAFVIGHSGTLSKLKNQELVIRSLPKNAYALLMGRGNQEYVNCLKEIVYELGLTDRVIFTGAIDNVNECLSACDVFAFPSLREGTPLALLEAQANGIPCLISENIPKDAIITDLVTTLPVNVDTWRSMLSQKKRNGDSIKYASIVNEAGFGVYTALKPLYEEYEGIK